MKPGKNREKFPAPLKDPAYVAVVAEPVELNVAVTVLFACIVTTQAPVPEHAPDHPAKVEPVLALAVTVTTVPEE